MDYRNSTLLPLRGYHRTWLYLLHSSGEISRYWQIAHYGGLLEERIPTEDEAVLVSLGLVPMGSTDRGRSEYVPISDDDW